MFRFKQFTIYDDRCAMKVGTDGVLLGAWVELQNTKHILDVGTGSGLIALMLAQRCQPDAHIDAIELEPICTKQAVENVSLSPWPNKVTVHNTALQNFVSLVRYNLIVSNPPYFQNSLLPPRSNRANARHANTLPPHHLIIGTKSMLADSGRLAVVLPFEEGKEFISLASISGFFCHRECAFFSREGKTQERWLLEFGLTPKTTEKERLILHGKDGEWSEGYKTLTRDFYLKL